MAAHHEESSPEYPLRFLQLNPVLVITGLGSQNEIFQTLSLLQAASMRQPHLLTFLDASFEALRREHAAFMTEFKNSHSASEPPCLLNFIKKDAKLNLDAQGAHRVYAFALETIASLGLYIAGGSKLHDRVVAHARSMIAHTSTTPLAAAVIENSPSIAAILAAGVEAVRFAFWVGVRSEIATGQEVVLHLNLLQCSLEQAAQLAEPYNLEIVGFLHDGSPIVRGPAETVKKFQSILIAEHATMSRVLPWAAAIHTANGEDLVEQLLQNVTSRRIALPFPLDVGSVGEEHRQYNTLDCVVRSFISDSSAHLRQAIERSLAKAKESGQHVTILSVGCTASVTQHILSQYTARGIEIEVVDLATQLTQGNYCGPTAGPTSLSAVKGTPATEIAIVGMSCRVPGAESNEEFWNLLEAGLDMCQRIPERLFNVSDYHAPSYRERNTMRASQMNAIDRPGVFDRHLFGISAEFAERMDPQQRLSLMVAYEALTMAGYAPGSKGAFDAASVGSFIAACSDDYRENMSIDIQKGFTSGTFRAHLATRLNQYYGFKGPAVTLDTACSSALVAIESACSYLIQGKCSAAIAGGVNVLTQPQIFIGLDRGFFLSATGQCKTFDDGGDGYSRADAVGIVVLKRLPDAIKDGDNILGVISSAATNHSGESHSITHPHAPTQERLYRSGILAAHLEPNDFGYIECHGTGTQAGDFEECSGLINTFAKTRPADLPLVVGSAKANLGHSESCSGATSLVKGLLVLEKEKVPKHIGIKTKLNTKLPDLTGVHIPLNGAILPRGNGRENRRSIMVNNFSAAGGNTSLIVRDGPHFVQAVTVSSPHSEHLFVLSAQTQQSLAATADRLLAFLDANPGVSIADLCYTLSAKRVHHALRLAGSVRSADDVRKLLCGKSKEATSVSQPPKVGIVFSGQGAQYVDMGRALYESSRAFRRSIQRCNWIARSAGFPDFVAALYPPAGSDKTEPSPIEFQLSMVAVEVALMSLLQSWGVQPSIVAGHSLGEYTALWSAGVLSLRDLIVLVGSRATLMVEHCTPNASTMIAVKASPSDVENLLATNKIEGCEIACYNSPTDLVVAGPIASVHALKAAADNAVPKVKSMVLPVPYAFHSRAVEPLMDAFAPVANKARFNKPRVPVISNVLGRPVVDMGTFTGDYLVKHMRQPVKFAEGIAELTASGTQPADYWIEVGPHPTTLPMLKGCFAGHSAFAEPKMTASLKKGLDARSSVLGFVQDLYFQGVPVNFAQVHESLGTTGTLLRLPNYAFDLEEYWVDFKDRGLRDHLLAKRMTPRKIKPMPNSAPDVTYPRPKHSLLTACIQLSTENERVSTFEARVNQAPFKQMVESHLICGIALTPATVFAELALEAAAYLHDANDDGNDSSSPAQFEVRNLSMFSSLFLEPSNPSQVVRVSAQGVATDPNGAYIQFFSYDLATGASHQHGSCTVLASDPNNVERDWLKMQHLIKGRIQTLQADADNIIRKDMAYSLFETIVAYSNGYQGMQTVFMGPAGDEAVSEVMLNPAAVKGEFLCSPFLLDSCGQLTGFLSNVGLASGENVYIADSITRIVATPAMSAVQPGDKTQLLVYSRMVEENGISAGSAYFTDKHGKLYGYMEDVQFKKLRRGALERLVSMAASAASAKHPSNASVPPKRLAAVTPSKPVSTPKPTVNGTSNSFASQSFSKSSPTTESSKSTLLSGPASTSASSSTPVPRSTFVHLGGPTRSASSETPLWLFPDGTGMAAVAYKQVPDVGRPVYGFDSPFLGAKLAASWTGGMEEMAGRFVDMLKAEQPQGPYRVAGWSLGGLCAYEVARRLLKMGDPVALLGLIDTPLPLGVPPLPASVLDSILSKIGKGSSASSSDIKLHFGFCAKNVSGFKAQSMGDAVPERVVVVNASDTKMLPGIMSNDRAAWQSLLTTKAELVISTIEADHFSIVAQPAIDELAQYLC